jgi:hypothetical protein
VCTSAASLSGVIVVFRSQLNPILHDFQTVQFETEIPAGAKTELDYETHHPAGL